MLFLFSLSVQWILCLPAHSQIIDTYAGPKLPQIGAQVHNQPIDLPTAVALDGSGGFYIVSSGQNRGKWGTGTYFSQTMR
jgi:hypothetical protein